MYTRHHLWGRHDGGNGVRPLQEVSLVLSAALWPRASHRRADAMTDRDQLREQVAAWRKGLDVLKWSEGNDAVLALLEANQRAMRERAAAVASSDSAALIRSLPVEVIVERGTE